MRTLIDAAEAAGLLSQAQGVDGLTEGEACALRALAVPGTASEMWPALHAMHASIMAVAMRTRQGPPCAALSALLAAVEDAQRAVYARLIAAA